MNDRYFACRAALLPRVREHAPHGPTYGDVEDAGPIPPDDPESPTVREIRVGAPEPDARPPTP